MENHQVMLYLDQNSLGCSNYDFLGSVISHWKFNPALLCENCFYEKKSIKLPLADNFLVLNIFAANSIRFSLWTHLFTILKAPLEEQNT